MAEERFVLDSVVRGFHVYKDVWNPTLGETLTCKPEFGNVHDPYAVSVVREPADIVGHIPRRISSLCYFFLKKGTIVCQVTGSRRRSVDLPQGGLEVPCTLTFAGGSQDISKVKKLVNEAPSVTSVSVEPPSKKKKDADEVFSDEDSIDLEEDVDQHWLQFQGCLLTELDKIAITSNDLLSDRHIHYAQAILSQQFPHVDGFKKTLLQGKPQLRKIQCGGIQIIHDRGNHWIVASAIGNKDTIESVQVYDSIFSCVAKATVDVIKNLFMVTDATRIEVMQMKHQTGSRDCGIFAIAVSTALLHGINVSNITFCQDKMRQHLLFCFIHKLLTPFPVIT